MKPILHSKPWLTEADVAAVEEVLRSGMIAQGKKTQELERSLSRWVCVEDGGVAVGSGSAAIVLALSALGVNSSDEVVLPTYVCTSVLEAVLTVGATPVLCDVGRDWVVTPENMVNCLNKKTKALLVPHIYGIFAEVNSFRQFGIPIIEDCAQAIDCRGVRQLSSDVAIFSFHATKCLTTSEGGMAVAADPDLVSSMRSIRDGFMNADHGRLFSPLSDISASLGLSQLARYEEGLKRRKTMADKYLSKLEKVIPDSIRYSSLEDSMFFRFPIKIQGGFEVYGPLFARKNIHVRRGIDKLLHRLMNIPDNNFRESIELFNTTVSLPIYPGLTDREHSYCVETAVRIFEKNRFIINQ